MKLLILSASLLALPFLAANRGAADALFEAGKWDEAREAYEELLDDAGSSAERAELLDLIGLSVYHSGGLWEAEGWFTRSLDEAETAAGHLHRGRVYYFAGRRAKTGPGAMGAEVLALMNDAASDLQKALALEPGNVQALVFLGLCERGRGRAAEEEAAYRKALRLEPGRADVSLYLAYLLELRDEVAPAREVLAAVPEGQRALEHLLAMGRLARAAEDREAERGAFLLAVLRAPENRDAYLELWNATGFRQQFAEFESDMAEVLERHPDAWLAHHYLGFCHRYAGRPDRAIAEFEKVLEMRPEEIRARVEIAEILRLVKNDDAAALPVYLEALAADPENQRAREVLSSMGLTAAQEGDLDTAHRVLAALCEAEPGQWVHIVNLALVEKERDRPDAALRLYEDAEERFPFEPQVPNDRGLLLMGFGREAEALAAFEKALERDPEFLDALENLGAYSLLEGDAEKAIGCFQRAYDRVSAEGGDASKFRRYLDLAARER